LPTLQYSNTPSLRFSPASGFTLIEVVVAFTVAALIIAAVASGLVATLRAEATATRQQAAADALRTLQTGLWLGTDTNSFATNLPAGWLLTSETTEQGEGTNRVVWSQWRIESETRRACSAALAAQQP
jgi:type II secretory pathway pseudopilin PulG